MDITDEMLKTAITKSVEAGLLPRRALKEDFDDAQEMMRSILECVLGKAELARQLNLCIETDSLESASGFTHKARSIHT